MPEPFASWIGRNEKLNSEWEDWETGCGFREASYVWPNNLRSMVVVHGQGSNDK